MTDNKLTKRVQIPTTSSALTLLLVGVLLAAALISRGIWSKITNGQRDRGAVG
jgi:hypothetical protein